MILPATMLVALFAECGAGVPADTLMSITGVESSGNPFVIANVTDNESYYLASEQEAIKKAAALSEKGKNFSAGLMQVNSKNFPAYNLTANTAFNYCKNINAGAEILKECYARTSTMPDKATRMKAALSCYYSGNFTRGLIAKGAEKISYVANVVNHADDNDSVPSIAILKNGAAEGSPSVKEKKTDQSNFFITDPQVDEVENLDSDDVVNSFVTDSGNSREVATENKSGNIKTSGSWDIFKDY